jgi:hypothetical protein
MQLEFVMEGLPRVWRGISWYSVVNASGSDRVVTSYRSWLKWVDGLGNGGVA